MSVSFGRCLTPGSGVGSGVRVESWIRILGFWIYPPSRRFSDASRGPHLGELNGTRHDRLAVTPTDGSSGCRPVVTHGQMLLPELDLGGVQVAAQPPAVGTRPARHVPAWRRNGSVLVTARSWRCERPRQGFSLVVRIRGMPADYALPIAGEGAVAKRHRIASYDTFLPVCRFFALRLDPAVQRRSPAISCGGRPRPAASPPRG